MFKKLLLFFVLRFDNACQKYEFNYSNVEKNLLFEVLFLTSQCFTQFKGCTFSSFLRPCVLPTFIFNFNLIGYGHIAPKTVGGKMFCLLYALIGIPLMIVFSGHIGDLMADGFRWLYSRICCRWCRVRR